jgi:hypothetical protein
MHIRLRLFPEAGRSFNLTAMNRGPDTRDNATEEFDCLKVLGVLPPGAELAAYSIAGSPSKGLLALWKTWLRLAPKSRRSRAARIHSGLQAALAAGAELTFDLPGRKREVVERWLGRRAFWWPHGVVTPPCVGVVSSRLGRDPAAKAPVMDALRLSVTELDSGSECLIASEATSLGEYIDRCAKLFDLPSLSVSATADQASSASWLEQLIQPFIAGTGCDLILSPPVPSTADDQLEAENKLFQLRSLPARDRVVAILSQRLFVLTVQRNGNWWNILQAGFDDGLWDAGSVRTLIGEGLCSDTIASELQDRGAVRWYLTARADESSDQSGSCVPDERPQESPAVKETAASSNPTSEAALLTELARPESSSDWLIHWTRDAQREWLGESRDGYLNSIILSSTDNARTALGTLERIIAEQVVRASPGNTRTGAAVVCLSDIPLTKLVTRRVFRRHRGRWDFEHYGIGIRTKFVRSIGGRPVIYGDESVWKSLPEGERLWFQPEQSQTGTEPIDWTIESEWRLPADLKLASVAEQDVFVFCATEKEAERLRPVCNWRVISVEQLNSHMATCQSATESDTQAIRPQS